MNEIQTGAPASTSDTPEKADGAAVEIKAASVSIGDVNLLNNIDIRLAPLCVTGLIGPNGAGKSTLAKVVARQLSLSSGECRLDEKPYDAFGARDFARRIAYLPQSIPVATGLTVHELVRTGRYPWHGALGQFSADDRAAVDEALAITGMDQLADRSTDTLSGGERQRCWIAMLLAQQANVLILDEPISALDIRFQIETMNLVRSISRMRAVSILIILHDINLAARYCDEIVALKEGRIAWRGPAASLIDPAVLEPIYDVRMTVHTAGVVKLAFPKLAD